MVSAIRDFSNGHASMWNFINGGMYGWSTDLEIYSDKYKEMHNQYNNYMEFAVAYDEYMGAAFNSDLNRQYTSQDAQNAYSQVISDLRDKNYTDTNSMYMHYDPGGLLFNVGTGSAKISTYSHYDDDGTPHLYGGNGLSIDIAKLYENNPITGSPVYTTQNERIYQIIWDPRTDGGYGMQVRTQTSDATNIYGHMIYDLMTPNSYLNQLQNVRNLSRQAGMFFLTLPPGTAIGRVGSTGFSDGPHLHYEMRVK
jgi:murein DD-endopeptidase MepM/ murein hydrolase activator NlpD